MAFYLSPHRNHAKIYGNLAIFGGLQGVLSVFIAALIYFSEVGDFNMYLYWVSNMGVRPKTSSYVFNWGLFVSSILLFWSVALINKFISQKTDNFRILQKCATISAALCSTGIFILVFNDMTNKPELHNIGAYFFFVNSFNRSI